MPTLLNEISRIGDVNIDLTLTDNTVLSCQKVVRVIPNKRVVCQGVWQGQAVYIKLFLGVAAAKYQARDAIGVKLLLDAKINTPPLLYQGKTADNSALVLIFAQISSALNAEQVWVDLNQSQRLSLAKDLVTELAKHHNAGLLQTDLYLKNFLVSSESIYTLDGDGIRKFNKLNDKDATQNLSILLSKLDVSEAEKWAKNLVEVYFKARLWSANKNHPYEDSLAEIIDHAKQYRLKAASDYADKKVFRQCSDVNLIALRGMFYAASSHANINMPTNLTDLDALMQPQNLLKNGNTCTVALAEIDNKNIVIKRYNIKNFWHGISRAFRPSRAAASWANAHRLSILGIATAKPIALLEARTCSLRGKAYFLAEYLDLPDVAEYFAQTQDKAQRAEAVKNIVTLFYKLYLLQISHGDMKASNIKMHGTQPVLIDLDSMRQHRNTNITAHVRDLQRFMQNWHASNQPRDNALYNAFVKTFKVVFPDDSMLIKAGIATNKEFT